MSNQKKTKEDSASTCLNGRSANSLGSWRCVKRSITPSVAALFVIQVTDFCQERWQKKQRKKASRTQETRKSAEFSFQPLTVSTEQWTVVSPLQLSTLNSPLWLSVIWAPLTGESRKPEAQLLCARPLETGDCPVSHHHPWGLCQEQKQPRFRSVGSSCCHLTLRMTAACGERQLKTKKENWRTLQSEICDLFHVSFSLKYNSSIVCFHQVHVAVYRIRQNTLIQSSKNGSCSNGVKYWMC